MNDSVHQQHDSSPRAIFRPDAVRRYSQRHATIILPRRVATRTIVIAWLALALLIAGSAAIWSARVTVALSGDAIIVDQGGAGQHRLVLVAFLPPAARPRLAPGQSLLVRLGSGATYSRLTIAEVEPEIFSPDLAQRRFAPGSQPPIDRPAAVVIAPLLSSEAEAPALHATDEHYPVKVVAGTQRLMSLLPLFNRAFPESQS